MKQAVFGLVLAFLPTLGLAGEATVLRAEAVKTGATWRFDVTVRHADTGWDHYADGWGIYTSDGKKLAYRELLHPHVNEQPFTRSLTGVKIPEGTTRVLIRANDKVHGPGTPFRLDLP